MLRKFIFGLALVGAMAWGAFTPAAAQSGPFCSQFDTGLDSWGACSWGPNIIVATSVIGAISPGNPYLRLTDLAGPSSACSTDEKYLGDWVAKVGGCGQLCFDFKVFDSGVPPNAITPRIYVYGGTGSVAVFVANFTVTSSDPWRQHICAPIALGATPPTSPQGHWVISGGSSWNQIITSVSMLSLPVDFTSSPSEIVGYDNICMTPGDCGQPPPPVIDGCLKDSKVAVRCNPDGSYTLTLSGSGFTGTTITLTSQTAGVSVTPPQQPWAATTTWTITGATPGETVVLTANATQAGGGIAPGTDQCCSATIKIVMPDCPKKDTGEVVVEKKVKNNTEASAGVIDALVFPIGLACTAPSTLNVSFGLINGGTHIETNVPYTSVCTVTEALSTLPPVPKDACGQGYAAAWALPVITPSSATISAPVTAFTVVNELDCVKVGALVVEKVVENHAPLPVPASTVYSVSVSCGAPANINVSFGLTDTASHTVNGIAYGSQCTISEAPPPSFNVCPPNANPVWTQHYFTTNTPTITAPLTSETLVNRLDCMPKLPPACVPPMALNADGICGCPPPSILRGKECVRPLLCHTPLIPNAAGTDCVCRPGLIARGGKCVEPISCKEPAKLDRTGTACVCPDNWISKGGSCVPREPPRPRITPNDVIRMFPGHGAPDHGDSRPIPGGNDSPGGGPGKR